MFHGMSCEKTNLQIIGIDDEQESQLDGIDQASCFIMWYNVGAGDTSEGLRCPPKYNTFQKHGPEASELGLI